MSEKKETKKSALEEFKTKILDKEKLKQHLADGIKSTNAKVRSLATKIGLKTQEHEFVKTHIMPLLKADKSKKVLRTISKQITRKDLIKKLEDLLAKKPSTKEQTAEVPPATPPKAP